MYVCMYVMSNVIWFFQKKIIFFYNIFFQNFILDFLNNLHVISNKISDINNKNLYH